MHGISPKSKNSLAIRAFKKLWSLSTANSWDLGSLSPASKFLLELSSPKKVLRPNKNTTILFPWLLASQWLRLLQLRPHSISGPIWAWASLPGGWEHIRWLSERTQDSAWCVYQWCQVCSVNLSLPLKNNMPSPNINGTDDNYHLLGVLHAPDDFTNI